MDAAEEQARSASASHPRLLAILDMGDTRVKALLRGWRHIIPDWKAWGIDLRMTTGKKDSLVRKARLLRVESFFQAAEALDDFPRPARVPTTKKRKRARIWDKKGTSSDLVEVEAVKVVGVAYLRG